MQALPENILRAQLRQDFPQAGEEDLTAVISRSGGFLGQARQLLENGDSVPPQTEGFVKAFAGRDSLTLAQTLVPMEKWKRDALAEILQSWLELVEGALTCRSGVQAISPLARQLAASRSGPELYEAAAHLKKAVEYAMSNVSPAAVCGYLQWALR